MRPACGRHRPFPREQANARAAINALAFRSVAWFARSDDNGRRYGLVKPVFDPGNLNQTIGNQIVVLPNGDLVMVFNWIRNTRIDPRTGRFTAAVIRSTDNGGNWSAPIVIDRMITDGVRDPSDGHAVRTGDIIPQIAVDDRTGKLFVSGRTTASPARSRSRWRRPPTWPQLEPERGASARSAAPTRRSRRP